MTFYGVYLIDGREPTVGSDGRVIWKDLKTTRGAVARMRRYANGRSWRLYRVVGNFYADDSLKLVEEEQ